MARVRDAPCSVSPYRRIGLLHARIAGVPGARTGFPRSPPATHGAARAGSGRVASRAQRARRGAVVESDTALATGACWTCVRGRGAGQTWLRPLVPLLGRPPLLPRTMTMVVMMMVARVAAIWWRPMLPLRRHERRQQRRSTDSRTS